MRLGVNIDHVATLRQARRASLPDPVEAARICERAGASSIVCHLREDRRHIQDEDVRRLRRSVKTKLNLEMSAAKNVVAAALRIQPDSVTFVAERRQELTTEGGLDVAGASRQLKALVRRFQNADIAVSLFIDPDDRQVCAAREAGADVVELHTGAYAEAQTAQTRSRRLQELREAAAMASELGMRVAAGHGLDYQNSAAVGRIAKIEELNIGFSIVSRALFVGLAEAVAEMRKVIRAGR